MRTLLAVAVALLLLGCGPAATPEEARANQEILDGIADQLAAESGVTEVTATYVDNAEAPGRAAIDVACGRCDVDAVYDASVRAVWASEVTPLLAISIYIKPAVVTQSRLEILSVRLRGAELTEQYGERPVPSIPEDD